MGYLSLIAGCENCLDLCEDETMTPEDELKILIKKVEIIKQDLGKNRDLLRDAIEEIDALAYDVEMASDELSEGVEALKSAADELSKEV